MSEESRSLIIAEDDAEQRRLLAAYLEGHGYRVLPAPDAETVLELAAREQPALVLMDVRMPGMGGLEGLARLADRFPHIPVVLLTAYAGVRDAVEAMRRGAVDYLEKPVDLEELATVISETIGVTEARPRTDLAGLPDGFIVASDVMQRLLREAELVAPTHATALITGESGTGKERVAEFIHARSPRSDEPFVRVNCATIPRDLIESELFGHRKGAFTGAVGDRVGRFESAGAGTLLLDEIGELPLDLQPKLLRVLEDGSFERVGESATRKSIARVLACTNRDLEREVAAGRFREDLFWRLNVFRVHLPPLRERRLEIPLLARAFLKKASGHGSRLSPAALRALEAHEWPGNVRELANVIERAAILAASGVVLPEHLPHALRARPAGVDPGFVSATSEAAAGDDGAVETIEEVERKAIRVALEETAGNRTRAAKLLGISRRTLLYRLKRYGGEP